MEKKYGDLIVNVYPSRKEMGTAAATEAGERIRKVIAEKGSASLVFAAAPSQNEFLSALADQDVDWSRVEAFHLDEYIGLDKGAPQGFGNFLRAAIFDKVGFKAVHFLDGLGPDPEATCKAYTDLLESKEIDLGFLGVGENGHLAFNDPDVADFNDTLTVKVVELDMICRRQQVNDGCFANIENVPTHALTLTIPALMKIKQLLTIVPGERKANAVKEMLLGPIRESCPASILREHPCAVLYLDQDSASLV